MPASSGPAADLRVGRWLAPVLPVVIDAGFVHRELVRPRSVSAPGVTVVW